MTSKKNQPYASTINGYRHFINKQKGLQGILMSPNPKASQKLSPMWSQKQRIDSTHLEGGNNKAKGKPMDKTPREDAKSHIDLP